MSDAVTNLHGYSRLDYAARWMARIDWRRVKQQLIRLGSAAFLLLLLGMALTPNANLGVLGFWIDDLKAVDPENAGRIRGIVLSVMIGCFLRDLGMNLRGNRPRYGAVFSLTGFGVLAALAARYAVTGQVTAIGFTAHVGTFVIAALSLWEIAQHDAEQRAKAANLPFKVWIRPRALIIPTLSLIMFGYALGLVIRPESVVATFAQDILGMVFFVILLVWLFVGGGVIALNSILANWLFFSLVGLFLFAFLIVLLALFQGGISPIGIGAHVMLAGMAFCITNIQTDYAGG